MSPYDGLATAFCVGLTITAKRGAACYGSDHAPEFLQTLPRQLPNTTTLLNDHTFLTIFFGEAGGHLTLPGDVVPVRKPEA